MTGAWKAEFERRALRASGAPVGAKFSAVLVESRDTSSDVTPMSQEWVEVWWSEAADEDVFGRCRRWDSMTGLILAMDRVEEEA